MKKSVFVSFAENFGWRNHEINEPDNIIYPYKVVNNWNSVEVKSIYPNESEAYKALNTLIWYCVWQWLKEWEYKDTDELLHQLRWPIKVLHMRLTNNK